MIGVSNVMTGVSGKNNGAPSAGMLFANETVMKFLMSLILANLAFVSAALGNECPGFYSATEPFYAASFTESAPEATARPLRFVSYNIHYGRELPEIIQDLTENQNLNQADFIFLQEVYGDIGQDSNQAQEIARSLKMNYVFSPSMQSRGRDYGNAILSRWPIANFVKVLLPLSKMEKCNQRTALGAQAQVGNQTVQLFNVHLSLLFTDTFLADRSRAKQAQALLNTLSESDLPTVIAGDFNTVNPLGTKRLKQKFREAGFSTGHTPGHRTVKLLPVVLDRFFVRNFERGDNGIERSVESSDHYPIWWDLYFSDGAG